MESSHEAWSMKHGALITGVLWRISILLLPWQIRWFSEGAMLNGFPWEQGRWSFYASWVLMVMLIVLQFLTPPASSYVKRRFWTLPLSLRGRWRELSLVGGALLILIASLFTLFPRATIQWWVQVGVLAGFFWSLTKLAIPFRQFISWFIISLIPHVLLAYWQYATQFVIGSKWLGMATQDPLTRGVSVVTLGAERILRVYGGFPHPNIFGGWLAIAIPLGVWMALTHHHKRGFYLWLAVSGVLTVALFLTYARAAWIACFVALVILGIDLVRRRPFAWHKHGSIAFGFLLVLVAGFLLFQQRLIRARFDLQQPLENRSIEERESGFKDGIQIFKQHPLVGVGPGAINLAISKIHPSTVPPVPPHNVFLLILDELGIIGIIGLILFGYGWFRKRHYPPFITLILLAIFDHYPWSLWSGLCLTGIVFYLLYSSAILSPYAIQSEHHSSRK